MITVKDGIPPTRRACGTCGRLGHLARTCTAAPKAHLKIGIEIEGLWNTATWTETKAKADNWHMGGCSDGSVRSDHFGMRGWEFQTRPGSLGEALSQLIAVYPDATNSTCGMHVHVSFAPGDVTALASRAFFAYFRDRWEAWGTAFGVKGEFWRRLRGENQFCLVPSDANIPLSSSDVSRMNRYNQLNFASYQEHATVECRLLPMFRDLKIAIAAVENLIAIYEDFLTGGYADRQVFQKHGRTFGRDILGDMVAGTRTIEREIEIVPPSNIERTVEVDLPVYGPCAEGFQRIPLTQLHTWAYGVQGTAV